MADRPIVKTRRLTRDKLSTFLKSLEMIKAFENLTSDVGTTLPDAIEGISQDAGNVLAVGAFGSRPPMHHELQNEGEANRVLAGQIFGG